MSLDVNIIRNLVTLVTLAAFLGIVWWAYLPRRKSVLDEQARSILEDEEP
jgi:cytochrome c oxidase cbb3-type subunit IV